MRPRLVSLGLSGVLMLPFSAATLHAQDSSGTTPQLEARQIALTTATSQQVVYRLRPGDGEWALFPSEPGATYKYSCTLCNEFEVSITTNGEELRYVLITGRRYVIRLDSDSGVFVLVPADAG